MDKNIRYNEPWILQRADPYVCRHTDGFYYFTASLPEYDGIALRRSRTLQGLSDAEEIRIWNMHESGIMSFHMASGTSISREATRTTSGRCGLMFLNVQTVIP